MENHLDFIHYTNIKSKASRVCWNQQIEHHQQTLKTAHANTHGAKNTISISLNFSTTSLSLWTSFFFFFTTAPLPCSSGAVDRFVIENNREMGQQTRQHTNIPEGVPWKPDSEETQVYLGVSGNIIYNTWHIITWLWSSLCGGQGAGGGHKYALFISCVISH